MSALEQLRALWYRGTPAQRNYNEPRFFEAGKVHDWRNHVPYEVGAIWEELSEEARLAVAIMAELRADSERWE